MKGGKLEANYKKYFLIFIFSLGTSNLLFPQIS